MRILVTGNMGYVGPGVVARLRQRFPAATIVGVDAGFFAHCLTGARRLPECAADLQYIADVRHLPSEVLAGVDVVVHLAAISNDPIGNLFEQVTYEVNHRASVDLAQRARDAGCRSFVFASSCSIYGQADDSPRTETSPLNPLTAYAKSKVLTERDLESLATDRFTVTALRFATACGMSDRLRLDLVVNDFVACAVTSRKISILSDGTPWRPLIHVKDMALAIEWAVQREASRGGRFLAVNVGSSTWNYRVRDLANAVAAVIPDVSITVNPDAAPDNRSYRVDFSLYERLAPEHQPRMALTDAVADLRDGLARMGFADPDFRNSQLIRLHVLRDLTRGGQLDETLTWTDRSRDAEVAART